MPRLFASETQSNPKNKPKCTLQIMIAKGSGTTTITLTWAIALLLNNRHVLRIAQDELDVQVGKERIVNKSDLSKLVYL